MTKNNYIPIYILCCILIACNKESGMQLNNSLDTLVSQHTIEIDNVIACASGSKIDENTIIVYLYPRPGATDIRFYETEFIDQDKNRYQNYKQIQLNTTDFFNGYLKKFTRVTDKEKWIIITFFENGKLHLSNPIRLKHKTKPTEFTDQIQINMSMNTMPIFNWNDGTHDDNAIYFQVVSDKNDELLSGTYTFEKQFQYYKLNNVVLNITREMPPQLNSMDSYTYTLMAVSEDNWVNLFIEKDFILTL